jgi:uncharacterized protein YkwD
MVTDGYGDRRSGGSRGERRQMARSSRRGEHARDRHSVQPAPEHRRPHRSRIAAPVAAFAAVLVVAAGGAWALGGRDGGSRPAGLVSDGRDTAELVAGPSPTPAADQASRDQRAAPAPALGPMAAGTTEATPSPTPAAPTATTTTAPPRRPGRPTSRPTPTPTAQPTATAPAPAAGVAAEVTRLTNAERAKAGCGALRIDSRLTAAAQAHSEDMVDRDYFSHTSPDGKGPGDRAEAAGYQRWSGENIAAGYPTPAAVVQGWMNSAGHKANILNCQSKATGVGYDARRNMWTQMFGFE